MRKAKLKKAYGKKLESSKGFSLIEVLAATLVLILIAAMLSVGIPGALNTYELVTATAEATTLLSTLSQSLADELRYATDIKLQNSDGVTLAGFTSSVYGQEVKPVEKDGTIQMVHTRVPAGGGTPITTHYPLLSEAVYTRNLQASISSITYDGHTFALTVSVYLSASTLNEQTEDVVLGETEMRIKTINE